ncbi:MAG: alpha/beta fold hydrolase [Desulfocapsaceae bacterium]|nr:alpha/beta fold hydrolase [Desulfocapsaceae bacterium]
MKVEKITIPAQDDYLLAANLYSPSLHPNKIIAVISSATAVPQRYYKMFALYLVRRGYTVVTYDYRGIGGSRPDTLKVFAARARDWALLDMAGVIEWAAETHTDYTLVHIGHSYGGQTPGLLPNADHIAAMISLSSQSGYWLLQGGMQKAIVAFHAYITLPLLSVIFGYMPWSKIGTAEDLPKNVALEWAGWCRKPGYLLDDESLPLQRYTEFRAPVLAYSFADDNWGTRKAVDAMMNAYPNVTRRHVVPADVGLKKLGHFGFFRPSAKQLWQDAIDWLEEQLDQENVREKRMSLVH